MDNDLLIGRAAVAFGYVSPSQLASCIKKWNDLKSQGQSAFLKDVFLREGILNPSQLQILQKQSFGRYKIEKEIGRGGMGRVYSAYDPQLDRVVALKTLLSEDSQDAVQRFLREAKMTAKLDHPNIIKVFDIGSEAGTNFFAMEFIAGSSLKEVIRNNKMSSRNLLETLVIICQAVDHAHSQDIVHRDLKPTNILMDNNSKPYVMDFGLAKTTQVSRQLSRSGMIVGTLDYMPPEQASGRIREIDARSDIYSLGVILYEICTGQTPFRGGSFANVLNNILHTEPVSITEIKPRISKQLESICQKAMAKNKKDRYRSAATMAEDISRFLRGEKVKVKKSNQNILLHIKRYTLHILIVILLCSNFLFYYYGQENSRWQKIAKDYQDKNTLLESLSDQKSDQDLQQLRQILANVATMPDIEHIRSMYQVARMPGEDIDKELLASINSGTNPVQMFAIYTLAQRKPSHQQELVAILAKIDVVKKTEAATAIIWTLGLWQEATAYSVVDHIRQNFGTPHPLRVKTKNPFNQIAIAAQQKLDSETVETVTLNNSYDSILLAKEYPNNHIRFEFIVNYSTNGTIFDTVGIMAAPDGAFNFKIENNNVIFSMFLPEGQLRDVRGWITISLPVFPNTDNHVLWEENQGEYTLTIHNQSKTISTATKLPTNYPLYIGDFPHDNNIDYGAFRGSVKILYLGTNSE